MSAPPAGADPSIGNLQVRPNPFSPNGDGVSDTVELSLIPGGSGASVVVRVEIVRVAGGELLEVLVNDETVPVDLLLSRTWAPGIFADGFYQFDVTVREDSAADSASVVITADSTPPNVLFGSVTPNPFDPLEADSLRDTLSVPVTVLTDSLTPVRTTVTVLLVGVEFRVLGSFDGAGTTTFFWDGRPPGSTTPISGVYGLRAIARDQAANADTVFQSVTVDHDAPSFIESPADTIFTTSFPVELVGRVVDDDLVDRLEASVSLGSPPTLSVTPALPDSIVDWLVIVDDAAPVPSFRDVVVVARDTYGHSDTAKVTVAYDDVAPVPVSSSFVGDVASVSSGERVTIRTVWNLTGLRIDADFSDLDSGFLPPDSTGQGHIASVTEEGGGSYLVLYDITQSNSAVPTVRDIVIEGSTGFLHAADTLSVKLEDRLFGDRFVSIDRNWFDPRAGEIVTIAARFAGVPLNVEIFDLSGKRVRRLQATGVVQWDGKNDDGERVGSGVYFLRAEAGDDEELRKVAVLKGGRPSPDVRTTR